MTNVPFKGHADNAVETLALDSVCIRGVTWQARHGAAWGESAGYGEKQDFPTGEQGWS